MNILFVKYLFIRLSITNYEIFWDILIPVWAPGLFKFIALYFLRVERSYYYYAVVTNMLSISSCFDLVRAFRPPQFACECWTLIENNPLFVIRNHVRQATGENVWKKACKYIFIFFPSLSISDPTHKVFECRDSSPKRHKYVFKEHRYHADLKSNNFRVRTLYVCVRLKLIRNYKCSLPKQAPKRTPDRLYATRCR